MTVKRYFPNYDCRGEGGMEEIESGKYVLHSDYARVEAERDAAKRCWDSMKEEWDKLVEENICLRKAGDGVLNSLDLCYMGKKLHLLPSVIAWNAAKEGKPHA